MPAIQTMERTMPVGAGAGAGWSPQVEHGHHDHHDGGESGMHAAMQNDGHGGMDHGGMDHGRMDHGGMNHGGMNHGGMDHGDGASMCKMSMVWNTDPTDLCLVFPWWRITSSSSSLYSSLFIVVLLGVGYEWLRLQLRRLDRRLMASGGAARRRRKRRGTAEGAATSSGRRSSPPTPGRLQQHRRVASVNSTQKGLLVSSLQDADDGNASGAGGSSRSLRRAATPSHLSDASGQDSDPATTATTPPYLAGRRHPTARRYVAVGGGQAGTATASVPLSAMFSIPALLQPLTRRQQLIRSIGYATSVGLSFLMMLLAMTYNSYVIGAVLIGAGIGHYLFQRPSAEKVGVDEDEQDASGAWGEYVSDEDGEDVVDSKGMACH